MFCQIYELTYNFDSFLLKLLVDCFIYQNMYGNTHKLRYRGKTNYYLFLK